ncbi:MAG: hypothetical protein WKF48_11245 [Solirubrobacteraceae bacterium]
MSPTPPAAIMLADLANGHRAFYDAAMPPGSDEPVAFAGRGLLVRTMC